MGSNSKQGWYLFLFLLGFTFLPAGLVYMGAFFSVVGAILLVASLVGFYTLRMEEKSPALTTR